MAQPIVVTYNLAASNTTAIVNAQAIVGAGVAMTLATTILDNQRRLLITTTGNESANTFTVVGTNQSGFQIIEAIVGPNATTTQSNLDFKTVISVKATATTAATTSIGTNGVGSSMWNIMNWNASPPNTAVSGIVTSTNTAVNYTIQYTYDDPNNLPAGVAYPAPFNHPTVVSATTSLDGQSNNPVTAFRLLINSGTGVVRATFIETGIGSP